MLSTPAMDQVRLLLMVLQLKPVQEYGEQIVSSSNQAHLLYHPAPSRLHSPSVELGVYGCESKDSIVCKY